LNQKINISKIKTKTF